MDMALRAATVHENYISELNTNVMPIHGSTGSAE
jgi:hypothetical protein